MVHMHQPELADYIEDFTRPYTSQQQLQLQSGAVDPHHFHHHGTATIGGPNGTTIAAVNVTYGVTGTTPGNNNNNMNNGNGQSIPSFLPIEDVYVSPQYQPPNPEDEDDVVPDQHAAFGITRAMDQRRDTVWRDLGLDGLFRGRGFGMGPSSSASLLGFRGSIGNSGGAGVNGSGGSAGNAAGGTVGVGGGGGVGVGGGAGLGPERAQGKVSRNVGLRVKDAGRLMGGKRNICLR